MTSALVAAASTDAPPWAIYAALITAGVGLLGQAGIRVKEARDRRREEYSRAFAAAMQWIEFPYRIARRLSNEVEDVTPIILAMHEAQQEIAFHENWLRSVSDDIANSYESLVTAVKTKSEAHIEAAWQRAPAKVPEGMILGEAFRVDVKNEVARFTNEIRRDLSLWRRLST
jgi:hypothetical protein